MSTQEGVRDSLPLYLQERVERASNGSSTNIFAAERKHQAHEPLPPSINAASTAYLVQQFTSSLDTEVLW